MCVMLFFVFSLFVAMTNQSQIDTSRVSAPSAGNPDSRGPGVAQTSQFSLGFFGGCLFLIFIIFFFFLVLHISGAHQCLYAQTRPVLCNEKKTEQLE